MGDFDILLEEKGVVRLKEGKGVIGKTSLGSVRNSWVILREGKCQKKDIGRDRDTRDDR